MRSLGGLLVAGFQLAAMSRADVPEEARRDFFPGVDEFQHLGNDAFVSILSEARKYRLSLTLSHQYLDQVPPGISDAVFRVGAPDTARLAKELALCFDAQDLVHLPSYRFCARVTRAEATLPAFSATTIPTAPSSGSSSVVERRSRQKWATARTEVELAIADSWENRIAKDPSSNKCFRAVCPVGQL
ncbi:MAG: hypothetical protein ACK47B_21110 [Armatimonadota bacterium]